MRNDPDMDCSGLENFGWKVVLQRLLESYCMMTIADLYTFDESVEDAVGVYELVCETYEKILKALNLPVVKGWSDELVKINML